MRPLHAVAFSLSVIILWVLWAAAFNTGQFGDNVEQFNWAQSLELGYRKHPPLPSWALGGLIALFGASIYWAYALAALCLIGTAVFTWLIGRDLLGERVAAAAVVLWGLNLTFTQRAQLYNHNTVMVLFVAAAVWFAMRATQPGDPQGRLPWWVATGLAAGAAVLSKYQALVPLAGLLLALGLTGRVNRPVQRGGLLLALAVMLLACVPHAVWMVRHDFSTLRYASEAIEPAGPRERIGFVVSFVANQVRIWFPVLVTLLLCWALAHRVARRGQPPVASDAVVVADVRLWMVGLVWSGLIVLLLMALVGGVSIRNHWGVQATQFLCLWAAWRWESRSTIDLRRLVVVALLVHAIGLVWYARSHHDPAALLSERRADTLYPGERLAHAAVAHWTAVAGCPLYYVAGTAFDAGLVSLYGGGRARVYENAQSTPWIGTDELRARGALYVLDEHESVPAGVTNLIPFDLVTGDRHGRPAKVVRLGILLPEAPCGSAEASPPPGATGTPPPRSP